MADHFEEQPDDKHEVAAEAPSQLRAIGGGVLLVVVVLAAGFSGYHCATLFWRNENPVAPSPEISGRRPTTRSLRAAGAAAVAEAPVPQTAEGLIEEASRAVDRLVREYPDSTDSLEMKARLESWLGKSEQSVKTWERCLELDPQYVHAYVGMAGVAAKTGDHHSAEQLARKALETDPESFQARFVLAECLLNLGRPEEVPAVLEEFLHRDPRSYGYFLLGRSYAQMQDYEKARQSYRSAVQKYAEYAEAYYGLSRVCSRLDLKEEASAAMAKYRELMARRDASRPAMGMASSDMAFVRASVATILTDAARVFFAQGEPRQAEDLWRRAAAIEPANAACRHALAELYRSEGRVFKTIAVLEELAGIDEGNPTYWLEIGQLRARLLQFDLAEQALRHACRTAPRHAGSRASLASFLLEMNRKLPEALSLAKSAAELEPRAANHALLAVACRANADHTGALAAIDRALAEEPDNSAYRQLRQAIQDRQRGQEPFSRPAEGNSANSGKKSP